MVRAIIVIIVAGLGLALFTRPAAATRDEAVECTAAMVAAAMREGYRLRSSDTNRLEEGDVMSYDVTFNRGNRYVILACGDGRAVDLDIYLYDEDGNLIDRDQQTDNRPIVSVTPRWTGPFRVRVKMYEARGAAHYAVAILVK